ncbi:MAG: DUF2339 domain-containing protein [Tannerella sp.]|nr:DUF2339 domain-containing protein [Tannerella sp.]
MGDFETIIFILIFFIVAILLVPIIILIKVNSLGQQFRELTQKVNILLQSEREHIADPKIEVREEVVKERFAVPELPPVPDKKLRKEEYQEKTDVLYREEVVHDLDTEIPPLDTDSEQIPDIPVFSMPPVPVSLHVSPVIPEPETTSVFESQRRATPPPVPDKNNHKSLVERILGDNWLSKIGIVTLVLGIAFFVKYAIDQDWINEVGRVGIGLLTGALIIGIAHKLKAKYHVFSSILVGGGISVFYITITLAFREYELFGQTTAFILLIITTIFSVLLSLLYDRKELAVFSLLGGFASPLMASTGTGNYIVLFSYIFILNAGMLIVSFVKQWRVIGMISYILTLFFFWTWTLISYDDQYVNGTIFTSLFFIQFYLLAVSDHFKSGKRISAYQVFLILSNNLSAYLAYLYIFNEHWNNFRGLITILLAVANALVLISLFRNSRIDRNLVYLLIAIVMSFVSLAIPIQLKGYAITLFWAAESVLLLWLWQKSRIRVFYVGFLLIAFLTLVSYVMDIHNNYSAYKLFTLASNREFITGLAVIASFVINLLLLKKDKEYVAGNLQVIRFFKLLIIILSYIVPFLEMNYQLKLHTDLNIYHISSFRKVALVAFTTFYIAILGFIYQKKISLKKYIFGLLYFAVFLYAAGYSFVIADFRFDIFKAYEYTYPMSYFSVHLLSLPAIGFIIYLLVRNIKSLGISTLLSWILTVLVVIISSIELDNLVVWLLGNRKNYYELLYDVHTFGYPILWGVIAMILMIWGLNHKEAILRKISLVFFVVIIVKFYAYDVWHMSQAGRIVSFVLLGVILLLVSFLQQKIRTLVKGEEEKIIDN